MGAFHSKKSAGQVLICGPPSGGKTTFLYSLIFTKTSDYPPTRTTGFHFETISGGEGQQKHVVGVWDIAGSTQFPVQQQIYQQVRFQSLIYVIDPLGSKIGESVPGINLRFAGMSQIEFSKQRLMTLLAEVETRHLTNVNIVYNVRANDLEMTIGKRGFVDKEPGNENSPRANGNDKRSNNKRTPQGEETPFADNQDDDSNENEDPYYGGLCSREALRQYFDQKMGLDQIQASRADCQFNSYLLDLVTERDLMKSIFDSVVWRLYLGATD